MFKTVIQSGGDLNEHGLGGTTLERAHLRLAAAIGMLKIISNDAITTATTAQGDTTFFSTNSVTNQIMSPSQWHILSTTLLDSEDFVKEKFALKLHKGNLI